MNDLVAARAKWIQDHLKSYIETDGAVGHIMDVSDIGGRGPTTMLILKTVGRRSGNTLLTPLIYGKVGDEYVIIASKGGADQHPAWYLNLTDRPDVEFQVADKKYRGAWRVAEGAERAKVWDYMVDLYPPYADYKIATKREIPVVLMSARETIATI